MSYVPRVAAFRSLHRLALLGVAALGPPLLAQPARGADHGDARHGRQHGDRQGRVLRQRPRRSAGVRSCSASISRPPASTCRSTAPRRSRTLRSRSMAATSPLPRFRSLGAMKRGGSSFPYAMTDQTTGFVFDVDQAFAFGLPLGPSTRTFQVTAEDIVAATETSGIYTDQVLVTFTF